MRGMRGGRQRLPRLFFRVQQLPVIEWFPRALRRTKRDEWSSSAAGAPTPAVYRDDRATKLAQARKTVTPVQAGVLPVPCVPRGALA